MASQGVALYVVSQVDTVHLASIPSQLIQVVIMIINLCVDLLKTINLTVYSSYLYPLVQVLRSVLNQDIISHTNTF